MAPNGFKLGSFHLFVHPKWFQGAPRAGPVGPLVGLWGPNMPKSDVSPPHSTPLIRAPKELQHVGLSTCLPHANSTCLTRPTSIDTAGML